MLSLLMLSQQVKNTFIQAQANPHKIISTQVFLLTEAFQAILHLSKFHSTWNPIAPKKSSRTTLVSLRSKNVVERKRLPCFVPLENHRHLLQGSLPHQKELRSAIRLMQQAAFLAVIAPCLRSTPTNPIIRITCRSCRTSLICRSCPFPPH